MKVFLIALALLASGPAWSQGAPPPPEKLTVELYDAKGGMIGEVQVEKTQLDQYTKDRKAEGVTVKPIAKPGTTAPGKP